MWRSFRDFRTCDTRTDGQRGPLLYVAPLLAGSEKSSAEASGVRELTVLCEVSINHLRYHESG